MIGYAEQARNGIANVLEKKINSGEYDLDTAKFVAERIMHQNAEEFYILQTVEKCIFFPLEVQRKFCEDRKIILNITKRGEK